jgi:hypothetical protein
VEKHKDGLALRTCPFEGPFHGFFPGNRALHTAPPSFPDL